MRPNKHPLRPKAVKRNRLVQAFVTIDRNRCPSSDLLASPAHLPFSGSSSGFAQNDDGDTVLPIQCLNWRASDCRGG